MELVVATGPLLIFAGLLASYDYYVEKNNLKKALLTLPIAVLGFIMLIVPFIMLEV